MKNVSWKKVWDFLWNSNSIWSWIADFAIIFLMVRFILYPLLGLMLSTSLPLVVVESGSMEHHGSFEDWWGKFGDWYTQRNFTREDIRSWDFPDGFNTGDIIITKGLEQYSDYKIGDVIIYAIPKQSTPIIHRIVSKNLNFSSFETKGDNNNNPAQGPFEIKVKYEQVKSKALYRIPYLGWVKMVFVKAFEAMR